MAALPYIQLYVADYLSDTMHLETDEHGAYLLLIMNYWQTGKPINSKHIKAITRISNERYADVIETLQHFFNVDDNGMWFHKRIEADLEKVREKSTKASDAGKKSAEARWKNKAKVTNVTTDVTTDVTETLQRNCNHTDTDTETDTETNTETETEKEIGEKSPLEKVEKNKRVNFNEPSLSDLCELIVAEDLTLDASAFINFYASKGWMVGKSKMKDWKAAARGWSARNKKQAIKSPDSATNTSQGSTNNINNGGNYVTKPTKQPASTSHFSDPSYYRSGTTDF